VRVATNFRHETHNLHSGERLHVVERFTRVDTKTLRYRVTVEDPLLQKFANGTPVFSVQNPSSMSSAERNVLNLSAVCVCVATCAVVGMLAKAQRPNAR
jgi:hypothetical protein